MDPESFARGGPNMITFFSFFSSFFDEGEGGTKKHYKPPAKRYLHWRFAGGPMMAQH